MSFTGYNGIFIGPGFSSGPRAEVLIHPLGEGSPYNGNIESFPTEKLWGTAGLMLQGKPTLFGGR